MCLCGLNAGNKTNHEQTFVKLNDLLRRMRTINVLFPASDHVLDRVWFIIMLGISVQLIHNGGVIIHPVEPDLLAHVDCASKLMFPVREEGEHRIEVTL